MVLAVSYMSELLEREMRVQEQRVRMTTCTVTAKTTRFLLHGGYMMDLLIRISFTEV